MEALKKLINQNVIATIPGDEFEDSQILKGKIIFVNVDDYYFYEKNEPIYITVNLEPGPDEDFDLETAEDYIDIPLEYIRLD